VTTTAALREKQSRY